MALIGNYSVLTKTPGSSRSGSTVSDNRSNFNKPSAERAKFTALSDFCAVPNGYLPPYCFVIPQYSGGMASYTQSTSSISKNSANLAGGRNLSGSSTVSITVTSAILDQIVSAVGSSSISMAASIANLAAAAGISGSSSVSITVTSAQLGAIVSALASSTVAVSTNSTLTALAFLEAEAGGATPLSPEGLANAVWEALKADHQTEGTMAYELNKKLNLSDFIGLK